jgi:hypothetical protein
MNINSKVDTPLGKGIIIYLESTYILCGEENRVWKVKLNKIPNRLIGLAENGVGFNESRLKELI